MPTQLIVLDGARHEVQRDLVSGLDVFAHARTLIDENAWDDSYRYRVVSGLDSCTEYTGAEVKRRSCGAAGAALR
ncbi:hypothetical protein CCR97_09205 [Rhodoplanes elegans]|uniref:Uncharacterized protein n=1 Tax=Rhodoplanes elegans TaxID=29408 RepID=A0A327KHC3_9BRAD|nr:hypothetical protein [Rhodoplanes elegans]MBK5958386.1 hypothetical protein [Rhodoplanes elegans]RAI38139.1 hypothetical protein CH338_13750 [Rhodoplanes elegans]